MMDRDLAVYVVRCCKEELEFLVELALIFKSNDEEALVKTLEERRANVMSALEKVGGNIGVDFQDAMREISGDELQ